MKLLFDQNLSHRLVELTEELFPDSIHVKTLQFEEADDTRIWEFAKQNEYTIISKDSDFHQRSFVHGAPPKVIWVRIGNCSTNDIYQILINHKEQIKQFVSDAESSFLVLD